MVGSASATSLTFTVSNNILQGQNNVANAIATLGIDTARLLINGVVFATGTGSATYNTNALTAGTYNFTAQDITGGIVQVSTNVIINAVPTNIKFFTNVTLTNNQGSNTVNSLDIMFSENSLTYNSYLANTLQNTEFFYFNGTLINSWLESANSNTLTNSIYWLKINPSIKWSGNSLTVYQGFANMNINLFTNTITGEAPQLSSTYAQYDNGANVFAFYSNFSGTSLSSSWLSSVAAGLTVNNGITINAVIGHNSIFNTYQIGAAGNVLDEFAMLAANGPTANGIFTGGFVNSPTPTAGTQAANWIQMLSRNSGTTAQIRALAGQTVTPTTVQYNPTTNQVYSVWANTISSVDVGENYKNSGSGSISPNAVLFPMNVIAFYNPKGSAGQNTISIQWLRVRLAPPNDIMPANTMSIVQVVPSSTTPVLNYSNGNSIIYNTNNIATVDCFPNTDNCALWYGGAQVGNGIDVFSYNAALLAVGSYGMYANDLTSGSTSAINTLVVSKATPLIWFSSKPATHNYNNIPDTIVANIVTVGNQVAANDYVNGAIVGTNWVTSNTFTEVNAATYTIVANSFATANYVSGTNTFVYTINPVTATFTYSAGNVITYGSTDTMTATCSQNTDNCAIWYASTQITNAIGSVTYNAGLLGVGSYGMFAKDITVSVTSAVNTLTINQATPILTMPSFPSNHAYNNIPDTVTFNSVSINNEVSGNGYLTYGALISNSLVATTSTQTTYSNPTYIETYTYIFNSVATANYVSTTLTKSYTISNAVATVSGGVCISKVCVWFPPRLPIAWLTH